MGVEVLHVWSLITRGPAVAEGLLGPAAFTAFALNSYSIPCGHTHRHTDTDTHTHT